MCRKNVLFNCSTNIVGGGVKNSALFIVNALSDDTFKWYFAISNEVYDVLLTLGVDVNNGQFYKFKKSPSRCAESKKELKRLVKVLCVDMVYTMAGPAYLRFNVKHVQGLSNGYITHATFEVFKLKGSLVKVVRYFLYVITQLFYSRLADYFIFQTNQARNSYVERTMLNESRTYVVSNAFDNKMSIINKKSEEERDLSRTKFVIFCPGASYIHKGFQYIPEIAYELKKQVQYQFEFVLTLPKGEILELVEKKSKELGVSDLLVNIGAYKYKDAARLYSKSDIVFVPSLLETFSATYLEAMVAKKHLIVSDKDFAHEVCGDYAMYINPIDSKKSAEIFKEIFDKMELSADKAIIADSILKKYGDQKQRFNNILNVLTNILKK